MAVLVRLKGLGLARVDGLVWTSDVPELADLVVAHVDQSITGSDPDPDLTVARRAVARYGGEVVHSRKPFVPADGVP
jgi:hypothetical protein